MKNIIKGLAFIFLVLLIGITTYIVISFEKPVENQKEVISKIYPANVQIANKEKELVSGDKYNINAVITPSNVDDTSLKWESSNQQVATVNNFGEVQASEEGKARITVTTVNGKKDYIDITVKKNKELEEENKIDDSKEDKKEIETKREESIKIITKKEILQVNSKSKLNLETENIEEVKWSSSNPNIISVNQQGEIIANNVGVATITVEANNIKDSVTIPVIKIEPQEENIELSNNEQKDIKIKVTIPSTYKESKNPSISLSNNYTVDILNSYISETQEENYNQIITYIVNVKAKNQSTVKMNFTILEQQSKDIIINVNSSNDYLLSCPEIIYSSNNNKVNMITIIPSNDTEYFTYQLSSNRKSGTLATWENEDSEKNYQTVKITPPAAGQYKIKVYSKNNTTRTCYSIPFNTKTSTVTIKENPNITCPNINSKEGKLLNTESYSINMYNTYKVHTGINQVILSYKENNEYEYTWSKNQSKKTTKEAIWNPVTTLNEYTLKTDQDNFEDRQAKLTIIDKNGDINDCYSDIYSPLKYVLKEDKDGVNIYFEQGLKNIDKRVEFITSIPKEYKLGTGNIYYLSEKTFKKYVGSVQGIAYKGNIVEKYVENDYGKYSVVHEMGHNLDSLYGNVYKKYTKDGNVTTITTGESITSQPELKEKHDEYRKLENGKCEPYKAKKEFNNLKAYWEEFNKCERYEYLRNYSYKEDFKNDNGSLNGEFFADIIKYTYIDEFDKNSEEHKKVSQDMYNIRDKYLNNILIKQSEFDKLRKIYQ